MPELRAIVFDLWGTLLIEQRALPEERALRRFEGVRAVLERHGIDVTLEEFSQRQLASNRAIGRMQNEGRDLSAEERARHVVYQLAPHRADHLDATDLHQFIEAYSGAALQAPPVPLLGAFEALDEARARGLRIGLMSNTGATAGRHLRVILERLGIADAFDAQLFSDELGVSKPAPVIFERALEALGAAPGEALFVGDTPRFDVSPPRRYGWWVVQVGDRDDGDPPAHARVPGVLDVYAAAEDLGLRFPARARSARNEARQPVERPLA